MSEKINELNDILADLGKMMVLVLRIKEKITGMESPSLQIDRDNNLSIDAEEIKKIFHSGFSCIREYTDKAFEILKESK